MRRRRFQTIWAIFAASLMVFSSGSGAFAASIQNNGVNGNDACVQNTGGQQGGSSRADDDCNDGSDGGHQGGGDSDKNGDKDGKGGKHNDNQRISARGLAKHDCVPNEWQFTISGLKNAPDAPATITVKWKNGAQTDVPLASVSGKTAYYKTTANLGSKLVSVSAKIDHDWSSKFEVDHGPCAQQVIDREGSDLINFSVNLPCGLLTFNGMLDWSQHFIYNEQKGTLNFKFVGKVHGAATIGDETYKWISYSMEQDILSLTGMAGKTGFNADGTPNLDPYGGSLENWLADPANLDQVIYIKLVFEDRLRTSGKKSQTVLLNHVVLKANASGLYHVDTKYFDCLCA